MKTDILKQHIRNLAIIKETDDPVISCYVNLMDAEPKWRNEVRARFNDILINPEHYTNKVDTLKIINQIWDCLSSSQINDARGAAIFVRNGKEPFLMNLKFSVPLPSWISLDTLPNIYPLIELKDKFQRYIVLLSTKESAKIFEIVLGEVSKELWLQRPPLRERVGREWTRMHYQNHRLKRGTQFLKEKIDIIDHLINSGGQAALVLAGDSRVASEIRSALPQRLAALIMDIIPMAGNTETEQVIASTLNSFIAAEERESTENVKRFMDAFYKHDLAVIGVAESLQCLLRHQADMLLISQNADLGRARYCPSCSWAVTGMPLPELCMDCGSALSGIRDARSELVRLAELNGRIIETVRESKQLDSLGGVGCILRYAINKRRVEFDPYIFKRKESQERNLYSNLNILRKNGGS